ncbi:hypothetical protein TNCV_4077231 [Trichonephila clavipes]|nr:hypothetical protein TNCV_4077231 [Trichonephila clavipes]
MIFRSFCFGASRQKPGAAGHGQGVRGGKSGCPRAESDLRVSLQDNGLVGPYSATVLVTSFSPGSSTCASRVRSLNSDLPNNTEVQEC